MNNKELHELVGRLSQIMYLLYDLPCVQDNLELQEELDAFWRKYDGYTTCIDKEE